MAHLSLYSDPMGAVTRGFELGEAIQSAPMRRELQAQQLADERLRHEALEQQMEQQKKFQGVTDTMRGVVGKMQNLLLQTKTDPSAITKDENVDTMAQALGISAYIPKDINDWAGYKQALETVGSFTQQHPEIMQYTDSKPKTIMFDQYPEVGKAFNTILGGHLNKPGARQTQGGVTGPDDWQEVSGIVLQNGKVHYLVNEHQNVKEGQSFDPVFADNKDNVTMAPSNVKPSGLIQSGNIDLTKVKVVGHDNGSISIADSVPFQQGDSVVLIPKISPDGKMMTDEQAKKAYIDSKDKKNFGVFDSESHAEQYQKSLESDPMWNMTKNTYQVDSDQKVRTFKGAVTLGGSNAPNAVIASHPVGLVQEQFSQLHQLMSLAESLKSQLQNPVEALNDLQNKINTASYNHSIEQTLALDDQSLPISTRKVQATKRLIAAGIPYKEVDEIVKSNIVEGKQPTKLAKAIQLQDDKGNTQWANENDTTKLNDLAKQGFKPKEKPEKYTKWEDEKKLYGVEGALEREQKNKLELKKTKAASVARARGGEGRSLSATEERLIDSRTNQFKRDYVDSLKSSIPHNKYMGKSERRQFEKAKSIGDLNLTDEQRVKAEKDIAEGARLIEEKGYTPERALEEIKKGTTSKGDTKTKPPLDKVKADAKEKMAQGVNKDKVRAAMKRMGYSESEIAEVVGK